KLLHGYAIAVSLEFSASSLDARNWVVDFGGFKQVENWLKATFDHTLIIAEDDPLLELLKTLDEAGLAKMIILPNVGCEAFAKLIADYVESWIHNEYSPEGRVWLSKVEVREHGANSAIYVPDYI